MDQDQYHLMASLEDRHWWYVARRQILDRVIRKRVGESPGRILEIGCGTGGNLGFLSRLGPVKACETNDEARRLAIEKTNLKVAGGSLPDKRPFADEAFDLVCMFDVLEHIEDDRGALASVLANLMENGYFILTVPAYMWLWSRHDTLNHHKRRYVMSDLIRLLKTAGFEPVHASHFNTILFPVIALVRLAQKALHLNEADDLAMPTWLINSMLGSLFASERWFVPYLALPFGVSILVVAQRKKS